MLCLHYLILQRDASTQQEQKYPQGQENILWISPPTHPGNTGLNTLSPWGAVHGDKMRRWRFFNMEYKQCAKTPKLLQGQEVPPLTCSRSITSFLLMTYLTCSDSMLLLQSLSGPYPEFTCLYPSVILNWLNSTRLSSTLHWHLLSFLNFSHHYLSVVIFHCDFNLHFSEE